MTRPRLAIDLDDTLGVALIIGNEMYGFQLRPGCQELLTQLRSRYVLCLWSVSGRRYVDIALRKQLKEFFDETYSWDELPAQWKDIRLLKANYLIDDSEYHRRFAIEQGIGDRYIVVPAYGSPEDTADPNEWSRLVASRLLE